MSPFDMTNEELYAEGLELARADIKSEGKSKEYVEAYVKSFAKSYVIGFWKGVAKALSDAASIRYKQISKSLVAAIRSTNDEALLSNVSDALAANESLDDFEKAIAPLILPQIRPATEADVDKILGFINGIAEYEKMTDEVVVTEDMLRDWLFVKGIAEVIFVLMNGKEVGFALFFPNYSTFLGRGGLYLEDLFVLPEYRGKGCGKALLKRLAQIAVERNYGRIEWRCLNWNSPSIDFYRSLGAIELDEWTTFRLCGDAIPNLANRD